MSQNPSDLTNQWLIRCLATPHDLPPPVPLDALILSASSELVLPSLYPRLLGSPSLPLIPPDTIAALATVNQLNADRNQAILNELATLTALLNPLDIQPLVLKGAAYLLTGIYPHDALGSRYLADLDLVIPPSQMAAAQVALHRAGYRTETDDAMAPFRHHHPPLRKANGVSFELHHSLSLGKAGRRLLTVSEMLEESSLLSWQGVQVRIPSPNHLVTHLILHSQIRHPYAERVFPPLRALYDLFCLTQHFTPTLNWPTIENRFRAAGEQATFKLHLLQAQQTLGLPIPLPITLTPIEKLRWLRRRLLNCWPTLRFFDPSYLLLATLSRRFRLLHPIISTPGGYRSALRMFLSASFYRRLVEEIF